MKGHSLFTRRDNYIKRPNVDKNNNFFFLRTAKPISTKYGTKHLWVKWIQIGPRPFSSKIITKKQKKKTLMKFEHPISTKLCRARKIDFSSTYPWTADHQKSAGPTFFTKHDLSQRQHSFHLFIYKQFDTNHQWIHCECYNRQVFWTHFVSMNMSPITFTCWVKPFVND